MLLEEALKMLGTPRAGLLILVLNFIAIISLLVPILGSLTVSAAHIDFAFGFSSFLLHEKPW